MRIIKPLRLGLLTRPYTMRRQHRLGVSVLALATLDEPAYLLPEAELWRLASETLEEDNVLDLAVPKPCAEFLVSGEAWAHEEPASGSVAVKARVAGLEKCLIVHGERRATSQGISAPAPVQGVPVDWRHTYGGTGCEENPLGQGAAPQPQGDWRLPNVEPLDKRISRPGEPGRPVSFGPVSPLRPRRFSRSGKYDPTWLENGFPGFPDTLDPHFFNAAEPDQWLLRHQALEPGAGYEIWNMHPHKACIHGHLPAWQARCFIMRHGRDDLEEVLMRHTTAWFFPGREQVILMFHGAVQTSLDDASDVSVIMPALEADAQNVRSREHFARVLKLRLAPESGALHAFRDKDLLPEASLRDEDFVNAGALDGPLAVNQQERARLARESALERIRAAGHDPEQYGLEPAQPQEPVSLDELPELVRRTRRESRQAKAQMLRRRRAAEKKLDASLAEGPAGETGRSALAAAQAEPPGGPPDFSNSVQARSMLALAEDTESARAEAAVGPLRPQDQSRQREHDAHALGPERLRQMLERGQAGMASLYLRSAHTRSPAPVAGGGRSVRMRRRVQALMQGSRDLSGLDLTGVDLSGMDLSGSRCHGTWMEMADLSGASLTGADLSEAVLTRARLDGTKMDRALLKSANLGAVQAQQASFEETLFEETILDAAVFTNCDFNGAVIRQCNVAQVQISDGCFAGAHLHTVTFWRDSQFSKVSFQAAQLERVVWLECSLDAVEFPHAKLSACAWVQSDCIRPLRFEDAHLLTCCAVQTDMPAAIFRHAWLQECSLRGVLLDGARFDGARLQASDLSESSLREAVFTRCDAEGSLLMACDLTGADMRDSDLIDVIASKSDFRFADLGGANLFRADISQGILDSSTRNAGAYVKWAKTLPAAPGASA